MRCRLSLPSINWTLVWLARHNQTYWGLHFINLNTCRECCVILSVILKDIHVEVGWLMGLQHTLVALKFGQSDASTVVL